MKFLARTAIMALCVGSATDLTAQSETSGEVFAEDLDETSGLHQVPTISRPVQSLPRVIFSPDGGTLFAAAVVNDASPPKFQVRMWGIPHGNSKGILAEHRGAATDIVISSDGSRLAVGTYEGEIILINRSQ